MNSDPAGILVVDDDWHVCSLISDGLASHGLKVVSLTDPHQAKRALDSQGFAVMVADIRMPGMSGFELLAHVQQRAQDCRVILITDVPTTESLAKALSLGAYDYLEKPFDIDQLIQTVWRAVCRDSAPCVLHMKAARALQLESLRSEMSLESIRALVHAVEAKDPYTRRHSEQVTHYAVGLAQYIQLPKEEVESIRIASLVHDIGKIGTPDFILTKPGRLTEEEFQHIRRHPVLGAEILENISAFPKEARLVRYHHEHWDGTGYPEGLAGEGIPLGARVINIADSLDAMLMRRTYKQPYPVARALNELAESAGSQFDPNMVPAAIEWCRRNPQGLILPDKAA